MRKLLLIGAGGVAGAVVYGLITTSRASVEKARYSVSRKEGSFEVREYPSLAVASAAMREAGGDGAFQRLFRFISGGNVRREKIAMTAPVFMDRGGDGKMSFVMPGSLQDGNVPAPTDEGVVLEQRAAEQVAVYRFPGRGSDENERKAEQALREWMRAQGLKPVGALVAAYYDAPWIPWPLRRNEVMLRVAG